MEKPELWWHHLSDDWKKLLIENFKDFEEYRLWQEIHEFENYILQNLHDLLNLRALNCSFRTINNIEPVAAFQYLEKLDCGDTLIADLSPIKKLKALQKLDLMYCDQVQNIEILGELHGLRMVEISGTSIDNLIVFKQHPFLAKLACKGTPISSLSGLENALRLRELSISNTQVKDISPLFHNKHLRLLSCKNTLIQADQIEKYKKINPLCFIIN